MHKQKASKRKKRIIAAFIAISVLTAGIMQLKSCTSQPKTAVAMKTKSQGIY